MDFTGTFFFMYDSFDGIVNAFKSVSSFVTTKISNLISDSSSLPSWLKNILVSVLDSVGIGDFTLFEFTMGAGLTIFLAVAIVKFFRELI